MCIRDRQDAVQRILKVLRFFYNSEQSTEASATGYKGFYYHFLKMETGERDWHCELSTIDTTLFIAGALSAAAYFTAVDEAEQELRNLADQLYRRIDWQWALDGGKTISHGWKAESGFLPFRWDNHYSEAMIMYSLAMGSPTFPINAEAVSYTHLDVYKRQVLHCVQTGNNNSPDAAVCLALRIYAFTEYFLTMWVRSCEKWKNWSTHFLMQFKYATSFFLLA